MDTSVRQRAGAALGAVVLAAAAGMSAACAADDFIVRPVTYVAVGDSLTAGDGATACTARCAKGPAAPNNGYAQLFARQLQTFHDARDRIVVLARSGATTEDALRERALLPALRDVVAREHRDGRRVVVSYWLGENDLSQLLAACRGPVDGDGCPVTRRAAAVQRAALGVVAGAAPDEVLLFDLADVSPLPRYRGLDAKRRDTLARITVAFNAALAQSAAATLHVPYARVGTYAWYRAQPRLDDVPYVAEDGLHPSDAGYRVLFALLYGAYVSLEHRL